MVQAPPASPTAPPRPNEKTVVTAPGGWPSEMSIDQSATIMVALENVTIGAPPTPVQTDGVGQDLPLLDCEIEDLFDEKYKASATARLITSGFTEPPPELQQLAGKNKVLWTWDISPKSPGEKRVTVRIDINFVEEEGEPQQACVPWVAIQTINVTEPFFTRGQITIGSIVGGSLGGAFSLPALLPALYGFVKKRLKRVK